MVPSTALDTAIVIVENYFSTLEHEDIDTPLLNNGILSAEQWDVFIKQYYQVIQ